MLAAEASGNEAAAAVVLRRKSRRFPFVSLMDGPIVATVLQQAAEKKESTDKRLVELDTPFSYTFRQPYSLAVALGR